MTTSVISTAKENTEADENSEVTISDIDVASYLETYPDYFERHPELLADLSLPHQTGNAVSLVERQVAVLRERSIATRHKLSELVEVAKENDQLFSASKKLILALLDAPDLESLLDTMRRSLDSDFNIEHASLLAFSDAETGSQGCSRPLAEAREHIPTLLEGSPAFCGILRGEEAGFIFGEQAAVNSAAIVRRDIEVSGTSNDGDNSSTLVILIAVGHEDAEHYSSNTGTLFIDYLVDTLAKLAARLL